MVFIIDGLDECLDRKTRCLLLKMIHDALPRLRGFKFIISSRPEQDIRSQFDTLSPEMSERYELVSDMAAYEDVRIFLNDKLKEIRESHPLHHTLGRELIRDLVTKHYT